MSNSGKTAVKICGIKTAAALAAALDAGADYVGLVFFPPSPRYVTPNQARALADAARGHVKIVALVVDPVDALLDEVVSVVRPDLIQLHGKETPERVAEIAHRTGLPVIKAISVASREDAERARLYAPHAALILFDAKQPEGGPLPGGNGVAFDWRHLDTVKHHHPFMLSGGLTPQNVAAAIALTGADIVDVSSGVELAPGKKSAELIAAFIRAAEASPPLARIEP